MNKRYLCTVCKSLTHLKCANASAETTFLNATEPKPWTCSLCLLSNLPFYSVRDLAEVFNDDIDTHDNTIDLDIHLQQLQQFPNHTSIIHVNTQSMCSTFDEFYVMCTTYQHDIITLSETWLEDI